MRSRFICLALASLSLLHADELASGFHEFLRSNLGNTTEIQESPFDETADAQEEVDETYYAELQENPHEAVPLPAGTIDPPDWDSDKKLEEETRASGDGYTGGKIIVPKAKGIVLLPYEDEILGKNQLESIEGLKVIDMTVPGDVNELDEKLQPYYVEGPLTVGRIKEIKKVIIEHFQMNGYPFMVVTVPKQCFKSGVLQLVVSKSRLGCILIEGNQHMRSDRILDYIRTQPCERINMKEIQRDLNFINRHPYRKVSGLYSPGMEPGMTDLVLSVEDRRPYQFYLGADNTGLVNLRRQRVFAGAGFANVLGIDSCLNFQFTTAYKITTFQSYTGQYVIFLPYQNIIQFYGDFSRIHSIVPSFKKKGAFYQGSFRYTMPGLPGIRFPAEFTFGCDFKRTNSTLFFSELALAQGRYVNITQLMANASVRYEGKYARLQLMGEFYYSPGVIIGDQAKKNFEGLRPGASAKYIYGKAAFRYMQWFPGNFEALIWLRGQITNKPLLPSEQYGLGGHDTVRGYDENQLVFDNAANCNFELRTPKIQIISYIRKWKVKDALQFLGFFDYGIGKNKVHQPGETSPQHLMSAGPGVRYTMEPYVSVRLDWGWKLHKKPAYTGGDSMVQFSAMLNY